jgi:FKBP-type peptidyl-prolyl cis-trans isomerase
MKRISIGLFLTFIGLLIFSACQENVYMDWKLANEKWFATHKSDPGFVTDSATGLCYQIIYKGDTLSRKPKPSSNVLVTYKGSLIDNNVFNYTTSTVGYPLSSTISAWQQIMPKLYTGAHIKLYVPSSLGYDTISTTTQYPLPAFSIPPNSVLIFDINLIDSQY